MLNILNSGFSRLTDEEFADKAAFIIAQLTNNANFPTTSPTLAVVKAGLDDLTKALALAPGQARDTAVASARIKVDGLLQDLAVFLQSVANVTVEMLATTGFDLREARSQTAEPPSVPANVRLKSTGISGEVQFLFAASLRAIGYQFQTALDPINGPWTDYDPVSSTRDVVARGLPRAKDVWGRVRALGPHNTRSGWSDPATTLVS